MNTQSTHSTSGGFKIMSFVDGLVMIRFHDSMEIGEIAEMMADMVNDKEFIQSLCEGHNVPADAFIGIITRHNRTMLIVHPECTARDIIALYHQKSAPTSK